VGKGYRFGNDSFRYADRNLWSSPHLGLRPLSRFVGVAVIDLGVLQPLFYVAVQG
jgi:hypothetical protein